MSSLRRRLSRRGVSGIRYRLGVAMAIALLPILLLSAVQSRAAFQRDAEDRRSDLVMAAERSATTARARIDSAVILLETLRPESLGLYCVPRLQALVERLEGYEALYRFSETGRVACASRGAMGVGDGETQSSPEGEAISQRGEAWFSRLMAGERLVTVRAPEAMARGPALLAGVRAERPLGTFDGALVAIMPIEDFRPDVRDPGLSQHTEVALIDRSGSVLIATRDAAFGEDVQGRLSRWTADLTSGRRDSFTARDGEGRRRVYAGAPISGGDIFVLMAAPDPGLWSWARLNPIGVFIMPLMAWLAALLAVLIFTERIVIRWLDYLERIAAVYAKGKFHIRPVQARNAPAEIRVLAETLDEMAETIGARDAALNESLAEKDALMREIHHRVKNNLQIISSLLSMQQRAVSDDGARAALGDTRQRISALALIYRTLYQSADIRRADLKAFLPDLVGQILANEPDRSIVVDSSVTADSLIIDPDRLAPVALWVVEAVSNAQKHAFRGRGGKLWVRFSCTAQECVLEVEDDGPGAMPEAMASGVGMTLMTAFSRQLRGRVEVTRGAAGGVRVCLTFPKPHMAEAD
ncbi:MAG: sensor histidine kinase [Brevundimonas sp.]|uniref:sensor histidine kinase PhyK n=1 Tax=Brevundimonas sp. TaxID=1871086 RepID=UPI00391AF4C8